LNGTGKTGLQEKTKPHWLFLVGGLTATGMLIFSFWSHNQRLTVASIAVGIAFSSRRIVTGM
jgi:hypothetical protein